MASQMKHQYLWVLDTWGKGRDKRWEGENHGLLFIFTYIKWRQGEYFNIIDFESWMLQSISAAPVTGENSSPGLGVAGWHDTHWHVTCYIHINTWERAHIRKKRHWWRKLLKKPLFSVFKPLIALYYHFQLCLSTIKAQEASRHLLFSLSVLLSIQNIIKQCKLRQWWRWNYSNVVCIATTTTVPYWSHSSSLPIERWLPRLETTAIKQICRKYPHGDVCHLNQNIIPDLVGPYT